jgi:ribonuclease P protein subunit RPR2
MSKPDSRNSAVKVANRHTYARISYLYQASNYLANLSGCSTGVLAPQTSVEHASHLAQSKPSPVANTTTVDDLAVNMNLPETLSLDAYQPRRQNPAAYLASHISTISLKSKTKVSRDVKRTICKRCSSILVPGKTSKVRVQNLSKNSKKPWADVLIVQCDLCAMEKRYPIGMERQAKQAKKRTRRS